MQLNLTGMFKGKLSENVEYYLDMAKVIKQIANHVEIGMLSGEIKDGEKIIATFNIQNSSEDTKKTLFQSLN